MSLMCRTGHGSYSINPIFFSSGAFEFISDLVIVNGDTHLNPFSRQQQFICFSAQFFKHWMRLCHISPHFRRMLLFVLLKWSLTRAHFSVKFVLSTNEAILVWRWTWKLNIKSWPQIPKDEANGDNHPLGSIGWTSLYGSSYYFSETIIQ